MELKDQIRISREAKGWTQEELAKRMNVSKTAVKLWEETGRIRITNAEKVADLLDVKFDLIGASSDQNLVGLTKIDIEIAKKIAMLPLREKEAVLHLVLAILAPKRPKAAVKIKEFMEMSNGGDAK